LSLFYTALGAAFILLGLACLAEKYRTVRGGILLPARIVDCHKQEGARSGGYCYGVEFHYGGAMHRADTNDAFWADHSRNAGKTVRIWYQPDRPQTVERHGFGTELLSGFFVALGVLMILFL